MKKSRIFTIILTVLMFVVSGIFIQFMPENVVIHFNFKGVADGFGSPYTYFALPVFSFFLAIILFIAQFISTSRGLGKDTSPLSRFTAGIMVFMNIINALICINAIIYDTPNAHVSPYFMFRIIFVTLGLFQIFLSQWISSLPYHLVHIPGIDRDTSEQSYYLVLKKARISGIIVGGLIALVALVMPVACEILAMIVLYTIWISVIFYFVNKYKTKETEELEKESDEIESDVKTE